MPNTMLQDRQTMLFIGDSITDCGRHSPEHAPLGSGYVRMFSDLLTIREPEKTVKIINSGIAGNTVEDLRSRWDDECLAYRPDWLGILIGFNDCNRNLLGSDNGQLAPGAFRDFYRELLNRACPLIPATNILLIAPFYLSKDKHPGSYRNRLLAHLEKYREAVTEVQCEFDTRFLDLHALFHEHLVHRHVDTFCSEPVHPNATGHMLIADTVYKALSSSGHLNGNPKNSNPSNLMFPRN